MIESVRLVKTELLNIRTSETFSEIFNEAHLMSDSLGLESVSLCRRKIPRTFEEGEAAEHRHQSVKEEYRAQFFAAIDVAMRHLNDYFNSPDLTEYQKLSNMLITGAFDDNVTKHYPRLCNSSLELEPKMYVRYYKRSTLAQHLTVFREMVPNVRRMFPAVEILLKILLTSPASSCEAERSFSALRKLKT